LIHRRVWRDFVKDIPKGLEDQRGIDSVFKITPHLCRAIVSRGRRRDLRRHGPRVWASAGRVATASREERPRAAGRRSLLPSMESNALRRALASRATRGPSTQGRRAAQRLGSPSLDRLLLTQSI